MREITDEVGFSFRNQERARKVESREKPTKLYHVSPNRIKVGEEICPSDGDRKVVFLSDNPLPHYTIAGTKVLPPDWLIEVHKDEGEWKKLKGDWFVYEVEPIGAVWYGIEESEVIAKGARVIRFVGNARSILQRQVDRLTKRLKNKKGEERMLGSEVHRLGRLKLIKSRTTLESGKVKERKTSWVEGRSDSDRYWNQNRMNYERSEKRKNE
ncbi:hypothetical protein COW83_01040 [Candidatus Collierbacteria bacterium CG22_combo_CG10-13_8_21_14_all_43_12]|uniref:Uncharacterized protein n=1 Tax=Candidatus Collierbacteria bacterium CG22_combo_CG10-13_8_21_14_all_43_12 TaxID=1974537 RepID=A0A2H0DVZ6_9BACT|nr:MAG: hypothetical protein COW83_01040 [Candidatus Collierbacteria bacterium CG22_combo_CG10-13_8_21_14_all_43_12]